MELVDAVFVFQMHEEAELVWHQRIHSHGENNVEVHYFVSGSGTFSNARQRYTISEGSLFITSPSTIHSIEADRTKSLTYYAVLLRIDEEMEMIEALERENPYHIGTNWRFFFEEVRDKGLSATRELRLSACHQLLSLLYTLAGGMRAADVQRENYHLERAIRYMQHHLFDKLTLQMIADHVQLDPSYFVRLFKSKMNTTPMRYWSNLRLETARALVTSTTLSIKEIAAKLHFCSEFHFSKRFKESTGQSPSAYRKSHLQLLGM
jgi:AraC-like DNA-binding protein